MKRRVLCIFMIAFFVLFSSCGNSGRKHKKEKTVEKTSIVNKKKKMDIDLNLSSKTKVMSGTEIFKRYNSAVFMIFTSDGYHTFQGSGFFISSDGIAVSNYHVFKGTSIGLETIKLSSGEQLNVEDIIVKSEDNDFIIFKVATKEGKQFNYIPVASKSPSVGDKVYAIGSPRGLENTFSSGEVSQWRDENLMQISALIDHGSSGGALINEYGEVVGITSGTFYDGSQANLNYAWSIDVIKPYVTKNH